MKRALARRLLPSGDMTSFERLLIPVDFSDCSKAALTHGLALAARLGAEVEILHAWHAPTNVAEHLAAPVEGESAPRSLAGVARTEARRQLDAFLAGTTMPPGVPVAVRVEFGRDAEVIVAAAARFDLVLMGTHGRTGPSRLILGSVAEKVARKSPCPVWTVHAEAPPADLPRRILVPIDFSEGSNEALLHAAQLARGFGASLTLLHVYGVPSYAPFAAASSDARVSLAAFEGASERALGAKLEGLVHALALPAELSVERRVLSGRPVPRILEAAEGHDLVVISTHGRSGVQRLALGSTAARIVRGTSTPVMTVRMSPDALRAERADRLASRGPTVDAYALFATPETLEVAYRALLTAGFRSDQLSLVLDQDEYQDRLGVTERTLAADGAAAGGLMGGAIGGSLAVVGALTAGLTGGASLLVFGPALALAVAGGVAGGLVGIGIPKKAAKHVYEAIMDGKGLIVVHAPGGDDSARAQAIMFHAGGEHVELHGS